MVFKYVPAAQQPEAIVSLQEYILIEEASAQVNKEIQELDEIEKQENKRKRPTKSAASSCSNVELPKDVCRVCGKEGHWGNECPTLPQNAPWRKKQRRK